MPAKNASKTRVRRKEKKNIVKGQVHINSTFNNSMVTITDTQGARSPLRLRRRRRRKPQPVRLWNMA